MGTSRVGIGYDIHRLVAGRALVLGGVPVPFERGLLGHSDGDVLIHAIMDALLGAAGLKDIGSHFPTDAPQYRDISSLILLRKVAEILQGRGWQVSNVDAALVSERPRLSPYIDQMCQNIAKTLGVAPEQIGIKVTTSEGLGFAGRGEGMAAWATALIDKVA